MVEWKKKKKKKKVANSNDSYTNVQEVYAPFVNEKLGGEVRRYILVVDA